MSKHEPPSPAPSGTTELQYGLHHLVQHNANFQHQADQYGADDGAYLNSEPRTRYGTPDPSRYVENQLGMGTSYEGTYQNPGDPGLGVPFDRRLAPIMYQNQGSGYSNEQTVRQPYLNPGYRITSPPTPTASDQSNGGRRTTRSGRSMAARTPPRGSRADAQHRAPGPRSQKTHKNTRQAKGEKPKAPKITAPLSELTKGFDQIPVKDMRKWVNRPVEERMEEVEKRNGYVTRPMNSFMLYRSAYADRTKLWCLQNNHQIVSSVSGASWPLEPPEIREQYNEYAKIERENHQKAHPGYKFMPAKAQNNRRKRKISPDEEEEPSDLEDADLDWGSPSQRRVKPKPNARQRKEANHAVNSTVRNRSDRDLGFQFEVNRSSYQAINPGRALPMALAGNDAYGQYYETTIHPHLAPANMSIEDVRLRRTDAPGMQYIQAPLIGLPGAQHHELLERQSHTSTPAPLEQAQLDPQLLAYDNGAIGHPANGLLEAGMTHFDATGPDPAFGSPRGVVDTTYDQGSLFDGASNVAGYDAYGNFQPSTEAWPFEADAGPLDAGSEFDKWMEENNAGGLERQ